MTPDHTYPAGHPQPTPARIPMLAAAFGLVGGPLAWFLELCGDYSLTSWSCFPKDHRGVTPLEGVGWSGPMMIGLWGASILIAALAFLTSWRLFRNTRAARDKDYYPLLEDGDGRVAVLALWGMLLSGGAVVTIAVDVVAFTVLPRCGG
jgi:hypothetical protein